MSIPVLNASWRGISCDFIVDLFESSGYDIILVFADHLTKMCHLVPCNKTTNTSQFTQLFLECIVTLYGLSDFLISDHCSVFMSRFWKFLSALLEVNLPSVDYIPSSDRWPNEKNESNC